MIAHKPDVLVVEDQEPIRQMATRWLEHAGYNVRAVASAEAAIAALEDFEPAAIVSDVHLEGQDGIWLGRRVRANAPDTALVFMSGDTMAAPAVVKAGLGRLDFLPKPFTATQLVEAVDRGAAWHEDRVVTRQRTAKDNAESAVWSFDDHAQRWVQKADWLPSPMAIGRLVADLGLQR